MVKVVGRFTSTHWEYLMSRSGPKIGQYATVGNERGRVVTLDTIESVYHGRVVHAPTVDISTPDGLLVGIPVRSLN